MSRVLAALGTWPPHPLVIVLALGALLRLVVLMDYLPANFSYGDSGAYIGSAGSELIGEQHPPLRPAGYPAFLRALHGLAADLALVTMVQHAIGLATAVLAFLTLRRLSVPTWAALVPAAAVALVPDFVYFEHSVLSETLFLFLFAAALYVAVRGLGAAAPRRAAMWFAAAGALVALATLVRTVGALVLPLFALAALLAPGAPWRERFLNCGALCVAGIVPLLGYATVQHSQTGYFGLTAGKGWVIYTRAAPFADCREFKPPPGTRALCESTPPESRFGPDYYAWHQDSPARKLFPAGPPTSDEKVGSFGWAAIRGQPGDYLDAATHDLWRYVDPGPQTEGYGHVPDFYTLKGAPGEVTEGAVVAYYGPLQVEIGPVANALGDVQEVVRIHGPLLLASLVLALGGLVLARGSLRLVIGLLVASALLLVVIPTVTGVYNSRYAIPAIPALLAAAAAGSYAFAEWVRARRGRARSETLSVRTESARAVD